MNSLDEVVNKIKSGFFFEINLFSNAQKFSPDYDGGMWLSKTEPSYEGFYLMLDVPDDTVFKVNNTQNFFSGEMNKKTYSFAIFTYTLNIVGWHMWNINREEATAYFDLYEKAMKLSHFILNDEETSQLYSFLD